MKVWWGGNEKGLRQRVTVHLLCLKYLVAVKKKRKEKEQTFKGTGLLIRVKKKRAKPQYRIHVVLCFFASVRNRSELAIDSAIELRFEF